MRYRFIENIFNLKRWVKRTIQLVFDTFSIGIAFGLAMLLRFDNLAAALEPTRWLVLVAVIPVTLFTFAKLDLYRAIVRFMAEGALSSVLIGVFTSSVTMFAVNYLLSAGVPRSVPVIYFAILLTIVGGSRVAMRSIYLASKDSGRVPVLIYGAGETGRQILRSLQESRNFRPAAFVDDDKKMHGVEIRGVRVFDPRQMTKLAERFGIQTALVAIPDSDPDGRRKAANLLHNTFSDVRILPKLSDLVTGRVPISTLRRLRIEDLLGREPVPPIPELMSKTILGASVMVTGAGGSIGSQLCRLILEQGAQRIVLFDHSEYALYKIHEELLERLRISETICSIIPILGSVIDEVVVERAIKENNITNIFHAAAYKHVPLVEANVLEGVRNNVIGTNVVAEVSGRLCVKNFTLISSDKAVRPTNIMGATKRLAELIMQAKAQHYKSTKYCAVRFGNVLASSGSVVHKFTAQVQRQEPITLTHPDITRYFMTVEEAAQLVVQASAMSVNGEIYLLDMGSPIKILDLAKTVARLNGKNAYLQGIEENNGDELPIVVTGLRPGEKLFEELLLTGRELPTHHPKIKCEGDVLPTGQIVEDWIDVIRNCRNECKIKSIFQELPLGYTPH